MGWLGCGKEGSSALGGVGACWARLVLVLGLCGRRVRFIGGMGRAGVMRIDAVNSLAAKSALV